MNSNLLQAFQKKINSFFKSNKIDHGLISNAALDTLQILKENSPDNLSFKMATELLNSDTDFIPIRATDNFLASGASVAEKITDELKIKGLEATLFPYQSKGVQWMQRVLGSSSGLILADEMGLGKTMQIIALLLLNPPKENN